MRRQRKNAPLEFRFAGRSCFRGDMGFRARNGMRGGFCGGVRSGFSVNVCGVDECGEKWMRRKRLGFKFRMELASDEPRMFRRLNNFNVCSVGSFSGDAESSGE